MANPPKLHNPLLVILGHEMRGSINFVQHARRRLHEREVTILEVIQTIRSGYHAVRGKTLDARKLRLAIAIKSDGVLVITAIDLEN